MIWSVLIDYISSLTKLANFYLKSSVFLLALKLKH